MRPRCLDLFCGAGGSGVGLYRAGFDMTGVDIKAQPRYPFEFKQADALEYAIKYGHEFDFIWASPPCQSESVCANIGTYNRDDYPRLICATRVVLDCIGKPYVIENVVGAHMLSHRIVLCGLMFGLKVLRHRQFESNYLLLQPDHPSHKGIRIGKDGYCCVAGTGDSGRERIDAYHRRLSTWKTAMGIDWMLKREITQAIPPAYTEFIGGR